MSEGELTHFTPDGRPVMVDVSGKAETTREAIAETFVTMAEATLDRITAKDLKKGDVLSIAQLAGIMGAKRTADLIPLCHPLPLDGVTVAIEPEPEATRLRILCSAKTSGKTGVEMEALTAASVAALTVYDMAKAIDRGMVIGPTRLLVKSGGKSGTWHAPAS